MLLICPRKREQQGKYTVQRRVNVSGSYDKPTLALTIPVCAEIVCIGQGQLWEISIVARRMTQSSLLRCCV